MRLGFVLGGVTTLGPGKRMCIWFAGCEKRCAGCTAPALQISSPMQEVNLPEYLDKEDWRGITGATISGGEPFIQPLALAELVSYLRGKGICDIIVYSGYLLSELRDRKESSIDYVLGNITALIDGEYIEQKDEGERLKGSINQHMHIFDRAKADEYTEYARGGRAVQTIVKNGVYYLAGLLPKGRSAEIKKKISEDVDA